MLTIINGFKTIDEVVRFDVVMFGTNIYGETNGGFQKEIVEKYPYVRETNIKQPYGDMRRLGTRITIHKDCDPIITILYICAKVNGSSINGFYRDSFIHALQTANNEFKGMRVTCPIIGASNWDGKQDKTDMMKVIEDNTPDLNLFIFQNKKIKSKI